MSSWSVFFFFKQKTAYEMRISDWSSDVCSSDLSAPLRPVPFDWRGLGAVLRVGIPIGIASVTELGIYLGATLYAATQGAADVAAHTLTLRTAGVLYAVQAALLQASMVRMARAERLGDTPARSEDHTSEIQSPMRIAYSVF